ncbi:MAG: sulfatase-like hydrolase/transferase [Acidobacteriota bacterium]|nr:MAG: sulfatase-like hydrolase/transferase [Acidobacteriota bacterium]
MKLHGRLLVFLGAALLAAGCGRATYNVVLISVDTLRADYLGCYGRERAETPTADRLAREGVLFEHAITTTPITLPAHASLMTGKYPPSHGVRHNSIFVLADDEGTLAEAFARAGYETAAFVGAIPVASSFGLAQGFDVYNEDFATGYRGQISNQRPAAPVFEEAVKWLQENTGERFFMWIHLFDPHAPYTPPEFQVAKWRRRIDSREGYEAQHAFYDAEVAYVDQELGKFLEVFRSLDLRDDTLLVFTADHGEGLGQHGEPTHGVFLYEPTMHVPLLFWGGPVGEARSIVGTVSLIDVAPTIFEMAGVSPEATMGEGISLAAAVQGGASLPERVFYGEAMNAHYEHRWAASFGIWKNGWKWIRLPTPELYNIAEDPDESRNLAAEDTQKAKAMASELKNMEASFSRRDLDLTFPDPDVRAKLESLGYVGHRIVGGEAEAESGPDPKDVRDAIVLYQQAMGYMANSVYERAAETWKRVLALHDANYTGRLNLALCYVRLNRMEDARREANRILELGYVSADTYHLLGRIAAVDGDLPQAEEFYLQAIEDDPNHIPSIVDLGTLYLHVGHYADVRRQWELALEKLPSNVDVLNRLGNLSLDEGKPAEARHHFKRAMEVIPNAEALQGMALACVELGYPDQAVQYMERAMELEPNRYELHYNMAKLALRMGHQDSAAQHFSLFIKNAPPDMPAVREAKDFLAKYSPPAS